MPQSTVGHTSTIMIDTFMDFGCQSHKWGIDLLPGVPKACRLEWREMVISFKPSRDTWDVLSKRAEASNWETAPWLGVKAAGAPFLLSITVQQEGKGEGLAAFTSALCV